MISRSNERIFDVLLRLRKIQWLDDQNQSDNGILTFNPSESKRATLELFAGLKRGGRATLVFTGRNRLDPDNLYFEQVRDASKRGLKIERLYLLPHYLYTKNEQLRRLWDLDKQSGIKVTMIYVGDLLPVLNLPSSNGLDFGIWDDRIVCTNILSSQSQNSDVYEWSVSSRQEDIRFAQNIYDELLKKGKIIEFPPIRNETLELDEPMVQSAPLMNYLAGAVCNGSYMDKEDCSWYHGIWQYLRIFDMVSTPTWHPTLYIPNLQKLANEVPNARILVSGTADYSTLAHIIWAFDSESANARITVLDLCQTPLILCQWYARHHKHELSVVQEDILKYKAEPFDAIVTDAFLTRFDSNKRMDIIKKWGTLLKEGGKVITTLRIRDENVSSETVSSNEQQVYNFSARAREMAEKWKDFINISPDQIYVSAEVYARKMKSHPYEGQIKLKEDFSSNGFQLEYNLNMTKGEMAPTLYAEAIATKLR